MSNVFTELLERRKKRAPDLINLAAAFEVTLELVDTDSGGLYLSWSPPAGSDRLEVQLWCMAFNWRVCEVVDGISIGRYWCYYGTGVETFVVAVQAVRLWQGDPDSEPVGWMKSSDGRTSVGYPA